MIKKNNWHCIGLNLQIQIYMTLRQKRKSKIKDYKNFRTKNII